MIFDRTQNDVDTAIILRREKVQAFEQLTEAEAETLERGMLTYNTLNRIEEKQAEVQELFNSMGYWNTLIVNKHWSESDIFNVDDFRRIVSNLDILKSAFFISSDTPETPETEYHWRVLNAIEKILYDLDELIVDVKSNYRECGTFESGE